MAALWHAPHPAFKDIAARTRQPMAMASSFARVYLILSSRRRTSCDVEAADRGTWDEAHLTTLCCIKRRPVSPVVTRLEKLARANFEQHLLKTNDETHLFDLIILQFSEVVGEKLCRYHPASPLWWKSNRREKDKPYDPFQWGRQNYLSREAAWVSCETRCRHLGVFPPSVMTMSDSSA